MIWTHFLLSHTMVSSHTYTQYVLVCLCASFLSSLEFFSSCFDIATFVRFLLCNSNKILVIQEIFRWYYKHLMYSLDTISHNCVVRTPHIYKWFSYTQRASYMFVYLFSCLRLYYNHQCLFWILQKCMNVLLYLLVFMCLSWEQLLKHYLISVMVCFNNYFTYYPKMFEKIQSWWDVHVLETKYYLKVYKVIWIVFKIVRNKQNDSTFYSYWRLRKNQEYYDWVICQKYKNCKCFWSECLCEVMSCLIEAKMHIWYNW